MADLLDLVLQEGASDLHLPCFSPPVLRIHGELTPLDVPPMQPEDTEYLMKSITSEANQQKLQQDGTVDFGFAFGERARFRVSAFRARGNIAMVLRTISNDLLTLEQIGLPNACKDILFRPRGLVLVTGPTGSGKSTTLASMIDVINHEKKDHIITIEDPIEFYHSSVNCVITQREVHNDVPSFADAIRRALRQDPDVILVGEMRDNETISAAITAAETG
ncbi:MAG: Flp pilus assembly complex ATPase component TadA, partial [Kiritimatiellae bacterium]|nr:Flp pilus assembly complex ATPase component TadA [Kiritimatiellia bacterium]